MEEKQQQTEQWMLRFIDPKDWGLVAWSSLFGAAISIRGSYAKWRVWCHLVRQLPIVLPCFSCRKECLSYIQKHPPEKATSPIQWLGILRQQVRLRNAAAGELNSETCICNGYIDETADSFASRVLRFMQFDWVWESHVLRFFDAVFLTQLRLTPMNWLERSSEKARRQRVVYSYYPDKPDSLSNIRITWQFVHSFLYVIGGGPRLGLQRCMPPSWSASSEYYDVAQGWLMKSTTQFYTNVLHSRHQQFSAPLQIRPDSIPRNNPLNCLCDGGNRPNGQRMGGSTHVQRPHAHSKDVRGGRAHNVRSSLGPRLAIKQRHTVGQQGLCSFGRHHAPQSLPPRQR